jgi:hypothetical protein
VTLRNVTLIGNGASGIEANAFGARGAAVNIFNSLIADNSVDGAPTAMISPK